MRVILYTGKGGVGKTSVSAATACKLACEGKRVLIMSTDMAHSLSDAFGVTCGKEPTRIMEGLYAMEMDAVYEAEKGWANLKDYIRRLLTSKSENSIEVEELLVFPGLEELFSMMRVLSFVEEGTYDVIILDCAPTGETLSLLRYPEALSNLVEKVLPFKRKALKVVGPAVEKTMKLPMPEDSLFDDIAYVLNRLEQLQKMMLDHSLVSVRIVTTPEQIVINEAKRNFTCMHLYDYNVDAIIVNKIYPQSAMEGYFNKWLVMQEKGLKRIEESFSEIPQFRLELQKQEIVGLEALQRVGARLYEKQDPMQILFTEKIYEVDEEQKQLRIYLPFVTKEELELGTDDNELVLSYRNEVRRFPIPVKWRELTLTGARMEEEHLKISFGD